MGLGARGRGGVDPLLEWKVGFFAIGAVFALVGMYFEERWMTGTAIVILAIGMFLRFMPGFRGRSAPDEADALDEDEGSGEPDQDAPEDDPDRDGP